MTGTKAHDTVWQHATTIALPCPDTWHALMLTGSAGAGKSELALHLLAMGARLVADDQTCLHHHDGHIVAGTAASIRGQIEMRGIGILRADVMENVPLVAIVDLDQLETERLPPRRTRQILGVTFPLLYRVASPAFAAALLHYMKGRHWEDPIPDDA